MQAQRTFATQRGAALLIQSVVRRAVEQEVYFVTMHNVKAIQAQWRGAVQRRALARQHGAAVALQSFARVLVARSEHTKRVAGRQRKRSIHVQARVRGYLARSSFVRQRMTAVYLQSHFRSTMERRRFSRVRAASSLVGSYMRAKLRQRRYSQQLDSVGVMQRVARGLLARSTVRRYQVAREAARQANAVQIASCVAIQRTFRAHVDRRHKLAASLVLSQFARRAVAKARVIARRRAILSLQCKIRSVLCFRAMSRRRRREMEAVSKRIKEANARAVDDQSLTLGNRTQQALDVLLGTKRLADVRKAAETLEMSTRLSKRCALAFAEHGAIPIIYALIKELNRSAPHVQILKVCRNERGKRVWGDRERRNESVCVCVCVCVC